MNRRITLVVSSLGTGGAERVVSSMCNYWAEKGFSPTLITLAPAPPSHFLLSPLVKHHEVHFFWISKTPISRIFDSIIRLRRLRTAILQSRPDVIISFVDKMNVRVLLSTLGLATPVIVSERSNPLRMDIGWAWRLLRKFSYSKAAAVVAPTMGVATWVKSNTRCRRVVSIPNAVIPENPMPLDPGLSRATEGKNWITAIGRLSHEKGFDLLLTAWSALPQRQDWNLIIVGDGPERHNLEQQAKNLGISEQVIFTRTLENPQIVLRQTAIFVLPSRFEGFPNALIEAMANGTACVAFDCAYGPGEIIHHGVDGILVKAEDTRELKQAISQLMSDPRLRTQLGQQAKSVRSRFQQSEIMQHWEHLIEDVTSEKPSK